MDILEQCFAAGGRLGRGGRSEHERDAEPLDDLAHLELVASTARMLEGALRRLRAQPARRAR